ncbi:hypothetical protein C1H46_037368 [Malus baccata]|uniref:RBR-type E3 ubiquitin transferase n=1 Tax=Malus baccata TaxID=106549 RepID=A0A540KSV1_MALBA|nr:hypothetical protein C1H46_037368 [Malus baccata]
MKRSRQPGLAHNRNQTFTCHLCVEQMHKGCLGMLDLEYCRPILPRAVIDRWCNALRRKKIITGTDYKFLYCPYEDCSALSLLHKNYDGTRLSCYVCFYCKRDFCATCKVPWHTGFDCTNSYEEWMEEELGKKRNWKRCASCNYNVEKSDRCDNMRCSQSSFICDFCVEPTDVKDLFKIKGCNHFYCRECVVKFIVSKLQDNATNIKCTVPGCMGMLDLEYCRKILPNNVFDRWRNAVYRKRIMESKTHKYFYCPFKDCSAMLIYKNDMKPSWWLCSRCKGEICASFKTKGGRESGDEDKMLEELAMKNKWRRCPGCKNYVEKSGGCDVINCRSDTSASASYYFS